MEILVRVQKLETITLELSQNTSFSSNFFLQSNSNTFYFIQ